jgi:hypothetical protein
MGIGPALSAQYVYTIKADSVKITNSCDTAELIIENHTQAVPGFLFNKGRGRTEFRKILQTLSDTTFLIGVDTLKLANVWRQGGNQFGITGKFGTLDNNPIDFYTNNLKRGRWTNDGHLLIGTDEDFDGFSQLQVTYPALFRTGAAVGTDNNYRISLIPSGYNIGTYNYYGPLLNMGLAATFGVNTQGFFGNIPTTSLIITPINPQSWATITDRAGNPTFVTTGGGQVIINGGYRGVDSGGCHGAGTDIPSFSFDIYGARGTGAGTPGDINFYTGNAQASGTTIHSMTTRCIIRGGTGNLLLGSAVNADNGSRLQVTGSQTTSANLGVGGITSMTAKVHIAASDGSAGSAPIKLTAGAVLTTPENGVIEFDGTDLYLTANTSRYKLAKTIGGQITTDFGGISLSAFNRVTATLTVAGAQPGDVVNVSANSGASNSPALIITAFVTSANMVTLQAYNASNSPVTIASDTYKVRLIK